MLQQLPTAETVTPANWPEVLRAVEEFVASGAAGGVTLELARRATVADESAAIQRHLLEWTERAAEPRCNLLLTTGGTGLAPRVVTVWCQNRRQKVKDDYKKRGEEPPTMKRCATPIEELGIAAAV